VPAAIELDSGATVCAAAGITKRKDTEALNVSAVRMNVLKNRRIVPDYVV
jgi:hypothetical protein